MIEEADSTQGAETDSLFLNEEARRTFEAFSGSLVTDDEDTDIMQLNLENAWQTDILEDISRTLARIRNVGQETFVLRSRYKHFLPIAV